MVQRNVPTTSQFKRLKDFILLSQKIRDKTIGIDTNHIILVHFVLKIT